MTHIEQMIKDMCPHGVEWKQLGEVATLSRGKVYSKEYLRDNAGEYPVYSSQTANDGELGRINTYDYDGKFLTWTTDGAYAGTVFRREGKFSITNVCGLISKVDKSLSIDFLYYWLNKVAKGYVYQGMGNPKLMSNVMETIAIPLPPIEIQKKIVECLDKFSALAAELQAELQMRRKQYEYYRTRLLTPHSESNSADKSDDCNWDWKTFAELGAFYGGLSGKTKEDFKDGNAKYITYLNIGCNPALRFDILETVKVGPNERQNTIQYGDALFTGSSETPDECAMSSVVTEQPTENIHLNSFCFGFRFNSLDGICPAFYKHYFRCDAFRKAVRRTANGTTRFNVSKKEFAKLSIPIPPLAEQERIVSILDKFEALTMSLSDGIPAEQAAQQKRYEYYRDKMLTFPMVEK